MNIFKKFFLYNKKTNNNVFDHEEFDRYEEIAKLVKESRIKQNLTIHRLSLISKIPEQTINSIENNIENLRPKYPFIRSILFKLEDCLALKKNTLANFLNSERKTFKREKKEFFVRKFDLINTWQGSLLYFFILILTLFILKRYFVLNVNVIEIQSIENKIIDK